MLNDLSNACGPLVTLLYKNICICMLNLTIQIQLTVRELKFSIIQSKS